MSDEEKAFSKDPFEEIKETEEYEVNNEEENLYEEIEENEENETNIDLKEKISNLEKTNQELKEKIESMTKKQNLHNSMYLRMSSIGLKRTLSPKNDLQSDSAKFAQITKEKDDLHQMNENMLDMLTEKELELEDLNVKFEKYKSEAETEKEKYMLQIKSLEGKIKTLENSIEENNFEEVFNQYEIQKERLKSQLDDYKQLEEELNNQIEEKDQKIIKLNNQIQNLEFENLHLLNKSNWQDKINQAGFLDIQKLSEENNKLKSDIETLNSKLNKKIEEIKNMEKDKDKLIEKYEESISNYKKNNEIKDNQIKKIENLNTELTLANNIYESNISKLKKSLNEEQEKNYKIQIKLDKNNTELKNIKEIFNTIKINYENKLEEYQKQINELINDKNKLLSQNKNLLEQLKEQPSNSEGEEDKNNLNDITFYKNQNELLNTEIKNLKEQINNQTHELVNINILENNIQQLKTEIENITKDNLELKQQLDKEKQKQKNMKKSKVKLSIIEDELKLKDTKSDEKKKKIVNSKRKELWKSTRIESEKVTLKKKVEMLIKLNEEIKKDYEAQIEKMKRDMKFMQVKYLNQHYEDDIVLCKYRNTIKAIAQQCKLKGIKLSLNLVNIS